MANTQEFECLVLGDEPAGLWLLRKLHAVYTDNNESPYFGWIQFEKKPSATVVPQPFAKHFGLKTGKSWHTELVTRNASLTWAPDALKERFPKLDLDVIDPFPKTPHRRGGEFSAAYKALTHYPELLAYASGFWKFLGRSHRMRPESIVLTGLHCHTLTWWQADQNLPKSVARIDSTIKNRGIEKIYFSKKGMISLQLEDQTTLLTRKLIVNTSFFQLKRLQERLPELVNALEVDLKGASRWGLYPLRVQAEENVVPSCVPPLSVFFDNTDIPSLEEEIWPFQFEPAEDSGTLTLWVSWPWGVAMEGLSSRFRDGFHRLSHLFPFLQTHVKSLSAPLSVHCHSQEARIRLTQSLEAQAISQFETSRTHGSTRRPNVFFLAPSLHAQLPYPFGPMLEAQKITTLIAGHKRSRTANKAAKERSAPPPS